MASPPPVMPRPWRQQRAQVLPARMATTPAFLFVLTLSGVEPWLVCLVAPIRQRPMKAGSIPTCRPGLRPMEMPAAGLPECGNYGLCRTTKNGALYLDSIYLWHYRHRSCRIRSLDMLDVFAIAKPRRNVERVISFATRLGSICAGILQGR